MRLKGKYIGFGALAVASVFLFDPNIAILDLLPDFIAYIMIVSALLPLSYICPKLEVAVSKFALAAVVSGARFIALFPVFGMSNQSERPMMILLVSFSFAVVELLFTVPAWTAFFDGMLYLSERTGAMAVYKIRHGRSTVNGWAKTLTIAWIFIKPMLAVLPEFSALTDGGYDDTIFNWYEYIGLFRKLGFMFGLVVGMLWLAAIERYWHTICVDGEFISALKRKYSEEISEDDIRFTKQRIKVAFVFLAVAFLLEIDFMIDYNNVIPDVLPAIAFILFFASLKKTYPKWRTGFFASLIYLGCAAVSEGLEYSFNAKYFNAMVWQSEAEKNAFVIRFAFVIIASAVFVAVTALSVKALRYIISEHAGYISRNSSEEYRDAKLGEIRRYLNGWCTAVLVLAVICAVGACIGDVIVTLNSSIYDRLGVLSEFMRTLSTVWWIINAMLCAINFIVVMKTEAEISDEIESRYMLD